MADQTKPHLHCSVSDLVTVPHLVGTKGRLTRPHLHCSVSDLITVPHLVGTKCRLTRPHLHCSDSDLVTVSHLVGTYGRPNKTPPTLFSVWSRGSLTPRRYQSQTKQGPTCTDQSLISWQFHTSSVPCSDRTAVIDGKWSFTFLFFEFQLKLCRTLVSWCLGICRPENANMKTYTFKFCLLLRMVVKLNLSH
jgi:hypothetical protein